jgi:predicted RNase H-like nuclease (RuvC/YqgF family)
MIAKFVEGTNPSNHELNMEPVRFGSWLSNPGSCRSAFRYRNEPEEPNKMTKSGDGTELDEMIATVTAYLENITAKYNDASNRISQLNREIDRYKAAKDTMQTALNSMVLAKRQIEAGKSFDRIFDKLFQPDSEGNHG